MTTCRLPLLGLVLTTLASSVAWGQSHVSGYAQPSSRQTAAAQAATAQAPSQSAATKRGNWFKRLVIGEPEKQEAKPASIPLSNTNQQPTSRQTSITFGTSTTSRLASPPAGSNAATPAPTSQAAATNEKGNWFQRLAMGEPEPAPQKTDGVKSVSFAPGTRPTAAAQTAGPAIKSEPWTAAPSQSTTRTTSPATTPPTKQKDGNWFKRLVVGKSADDRAENKTVQFAAPQPSSRQSGVTRLPAPNAPTSAQASASKATTAPAHVTASSSEERPGWFRRLVIGAPQAEGKTSNPAPPVAAQSPKARMMSGLLGSPEAQTNGSQMNSVAGQRPPAHVPRTLSGSTESPVVIADSLNDAKATAQKNKIEPDSNGSVSLTNWISRRNSRPPAGETAPPQSNSLAPAVVADRSATATARQPVAAAQQPIASWPTPSAGSGDPRRAANGGFAAAQRTAKSDSEGSLTGWLTRPFRSAGDADKELPAAQQSAQAQPGNNAPVRLPAVAQTGARTSTGNYTRLESPSAPPIVGDTNVLAAGATSANSASSARIGSNVRTAAADASQVGLVAETMGGPTNASSAEDFSNRVAPTTAYQPMGAAPMQPGPLPAASEPTTAWPLVDHEYDTPSSPEASAESSGNPLGRPKIIFNPVAGMNGRGQATLKPTVQVAHDDENTGGYFPMHFAQVPLEGDSLPPPRPYASQEGFDGIEGPVGPDGVAEIPGEPLPDMWVPMDPPYEGPMTAHEAAGPFLECFYTVMAHLNGPRSCPEGIGVENVMNAPFWLDTTQPLQNCRIRADAAADWEFPDRIEYFWSKTPGPKGAQMEFDAFGGEPNVDYQELSFYIERGGERFSVGTDLPIRTIDPVVRRNTTGFGDMRVTTKAVLLDGKDWQLTQVFHTHIPTGSFRRGTGNGHVSLEPGVAWRYKWSDVTYIHGDLTYWFPIAADPFHSGQMFNYGIGISHIWIDGDKWALMPTLELNAWTLLDGRQTFPGEIDDPLDPRGEIDTLSILNIHPGLRWVCDTAGDCGVREFGITSGIAVTEDHWYEEILRLEMRWVF
ncbi:MAG TPA: transporter [Lacipirellulaceae bacterium]